MDIQSRLIVSVVLLIVLFWLLRSFFHKKLSSGQVLFWIGLILGAEILTLFPALVHKVSALWGNLIPVSWITFSGLVFLIFYLLYQSVQLNELQFQVVELTRNIALLKMRSAEGGLQNRNKSSDSVSAT